MFCEAARYGWKVHGFWSNIDIDSNDKLAHNNFESFWNVQKLSEPPLLHTKKTPMFFWGLIGKIVQECPAYCVA